jgi:hypothetical protein
MVEAERALEGVRASLEGEIASTLQAPNTDRCGNGLASLITLTEIAQTVGLATGASDALQVRLREDAAACMKDGTLDFTREAFSTRDAFGLACPPVRIASGALSFFRRADDVLQGGGPTQFDVAWRCPGEEGVIALDIHALNEVTLGGQFDGEVLRFSAPVWRSREGTATANVAEHVPPLLTALWIEPSLTVTTPLFRLQVTYGAEALPYELIFVPLNGARYSQVQRFEDGVVVDTWVLRM